MGYRKTAGQKQKVQMMVPYETTDPKGKKHTIKFDRDLAWLQPYIARARRLGVPIWRIRAIKGYWVAKGKTEAQDAQIIRDDNNRKFTITILKKQQILQGDGKKVRFLTYKEAPDGYLYEAVLSSLAHELAHMIHWDHTVERFVVEARLLLAFARMAREQGYKGYD